MRHMTKVIVLSALAFLAGCPDDNIPNTVLTGGENSAGKAVTIGGLGYMRTHESIPNREGTTNPQGGFAYFAGDTINFYLDCAGQVPIAKLTLEDSSTESVNLFEHVDIDGAKSQEQINKLMILLLALDGDTEAPGVQIPKRVCEAASDHAAGLISVLKDGTPGALHGNAAVDALLAAMNEDKTSDDLPTLNEARAFFGLAPLDISRYPYENVYGDVCQTSEPIPGCTFYTSTGKRVGVSSDPSYNTTGAGSDDVWYVKFDSAGKGSVFNEYGEPQYDKDVSEFAGYISGTTIGVGITGAFWEDVSGKQYWLGKNGVLYSANQSASNYGQAIN